MNRTSLTFTILSLVFFTIGNSGAYGQSLIPSSDELRSIAEGNLLNFITGDDFGKNASAAIIRGEIWTVKFNSGEKKDWICCTIDVPEEKLSYLGAAQYANASDLSPRLWQQSVRLDSEKFVRFGGGDSGDLLVFDSTAADSQSDKSQKGLSKNYVMAARPYMIAAATIGGMMIGEVTREYGYNAFVDNARFLGAKVGREGECVGVWNIGGTSGSVVEVYFDGLRNANPRRFVWRTASSSGVSYETFSAERIFCVSETEWDMVKFEDTERSVPGKFKIVGLGSEGIPEYEVVGFVRWKFGDEVQRPKWSSAWLRQINKNNDMDWRDPIKSTFTETWDFSYRDTLEKIENP